LCNMLSYHFLPQNYSDMLKQVLKTFACASTLIMVGEWRFHRMALDHYGVADFTVYHSDVIREFSENFGRLWLTFWGIGEQ
jgi:hypothetical protein